MSAVHEPVQGRETREHVAVPAGHATPLWLTPLFLAGLVVFYVGRRVLSEGSTGLVLTVFGALGVLVPTGLRLMPRLRASEEHRAIDKLLAVCSCLGVLALVLYGLSTTEGLGLLLGDDRRLAVPLKAVLQVAFVSLLVLSVLPLVFAETSLYPMRRAPRVESRRVRFALSAGVSLALAAIYGSLFVYAADDSGLKADFSYFKTSEPSESTRQVLSTASEPVELVAFFPDANDVRDEVAAYLTGLGGQNLSVRFADRLLEPELARDLRVRTDGVLVLKRGEATESLEIGTDMGKAQKRLRKLDADLQATLAKLTKKPRVAYLTTGHGELGDGKTGGAGSSASGMKLLAEAQNFTVKNLGLNEGLARDVPADADLVVVLGPSEPFAPEELASLRRYLDAGGRVLLALEPRAEFAEGKLPTAAGVGVEAGVPAHELAEALGLVVTPGVLANAEQHARRRMNDSDRALLVTNKFSSHPSVSMLSRSGAGVVVMGAAGLEKAKDSTEQVDFAIRSYPGTFADLDANFVAEGAAETKKVHNLAAAVVRPTPEPGARTGELRAYVLGDADVLSDVAMQSVVGNRALAADALRWLGGEDVAVGAPNNEEDVRLEHTREQDAVWFYSTIFGVPVLVLGLGLGLRARLRRGGGKS